MKKNIFILLIGCCQLLFSQRDTLSLEKIWASGDLYPTHLQEMQPMHSGNSFSILDKQGVIIQNFNNPDAQLIKGNFDIYEFSSNDEWLLVASNQQAIYRHSFKASYEIIEVKTNKRTTIFDGKLIQEVHFSPSNDKVSFIYENNLYYYDIPSKQTHQITTDGKINVIINGTTDWVYEEEFGFTQAYEWNKTGQYIAYIRLDESEVPEVQLPIYQSSTYPASLVYKYPKAGEKNAKASLHTYSLANQSNKEVDLNAYTDFYLPKIAFSSENNSELYAMVSNRFQNQLDVLQINVDKGTTKKLFTEKDAAWIETDKIKFNTTPEGIIWLSERDGYAHLYLLDYNDGKVIKQLTKGNYEITDYYGYYKGKAYFQSTHEGSINRSIYSVQINNQNLTKLSEKTGNNEAVFSGDYSLFINTYSAPNIPPYYTLNDGTKINEIKVLEDNKRLVNTMNSLELSKQEFSTIILPNGTEVNSWMMKPSQMKKGKKYPVLVYVYGGPGHQTVKNEFGYFNYFWFQYLVKQGYIVVSIDGRGTGGKGAKFKKSTYKNLGKYEAEDVISFGKYLQKQDFINPDRIGIFGWSFGGYLSTLAMTKGADVFTTGIAVAPVTNWRFYDTIYTERFLQTPQVNAEGYDTNSPLNFANLLTGNYLIISGTADDNVHIQNTYQMTNRLTDLNKKFDMQIYTDKNHGIYGGNTRLHLYNKMTEFLRKKL